MISELESHLLPPFPLHVEHDSQGLPGLVRPELVHQVVHVDKEQVEVFNLLISLGIVRRFYEEIKQVQKVDKNRMVKLLQLFFPIEVFVRVEPAEPLRLQTGGEMRAGVKNMCLFATKSSVLLTWI